MQNIQNIKTDDLYKMLSLKQFQDADSPKMIKDEIKFRNAGVSMNQMKSIIK